MRFFESLTSPQATVQAANTGEQMPQTAGSLNQVSPASEVPSQSDQADKILDTGTMEQPTLPLDTVQFWDHWDEGFDWLKSGFMLPADSTDK